LEKKETTILCTGNSPDSDGTGIPTTSDGMRNSDELYKCSLASKQCEPLRQALKMKREEEEHPLHELGRNTIQRQAADLLDQLTDEERGEVFYFYCMYCGAKQYRSAADKHGCYCMRDD